MRCHVTNWNGRSRSSSVLMTIMRSGALGPFVLVAVREECRTNGGRGSDSEVLLEQLVN